jgi:carboxyl-terminal processing protease
MGEKITQSPSNQPGENITRPRLIGWALGLILLGGLVGIFGYKIYLGRTSTATATAEQFREIHSILKSSFNGDLNDEKQAEGALRGYVASLGDPYTVFLSAKEAQELSDDLAGQLSGIGVEVGLKGNRLTVISPIDETPADQAGIRAGDVIASIEGQSTAEMSLDEAVKKIRGEKGTQVKLTIVREGEEPKDLTITRDQIKVSSVKYEVKDGGVGYIRVRRFGDDTDTAIRNATADLAKQGVNKIVLDLRDNPGGYLNSAVSVTSEFLANGVVVEERGRHMENKQLVANPGGNLTDAKLVILINDGSASASEITAGALKDNGRATLVGEKTYGKGSVQEVKSLSSGAQLKVTVASWFTPNGVNISKEGIKPDIEVKFSKEDADSGRDPQLDKALEVVRQ